MSAAPAPAKSKNLSAAEKAQREAAALAARSAAKSFLQQHGLDRESAATSLASIDNTLRTLHSSVTEELRAKAAKAAAPAAGAASAAFAKRPAAASTAGGAAGGPSLPDGWRATLDPGSGRNYYFHAASGRTQWEPPEAGSAMPLAPPVAAGSSSSASGSSNGLPAGWFRAAGAGGREYYYTASGLTQWTAPTQPAPGSAPAPAAAPTAVAVPASAYRSLPASHAGPSLPARAPGAAPVASRAAEDAADERASGGYGGGGRGRGGGPPGRGGGGGGDRGRGGGRGRGRGGGGHHRLPDSSAADPLDPTGTGGRWSDGLDVGRPSAAAAAAAAGALAGQKRRLDG